MSRQTGRRLVRDEKRETVEGEGKDEDRDGEREGEWDHLWGPEHCPASQQNLFECGRVDVSFASEQEKEWQERRDKERQSADALRTNARGVVFGANRGRWTGSPSTTGWIPGLEPA